MLPRVDRGNQHRVGKRICRALQQRGFGLVMAYTHLDVYKRQVITLFSTSDGCE
ncbi:hypothetical protein AZZ97_005359 [Klebsiella pneumoniae]|nr:hypothetical protein AZZ97_005359 [Klebsiella pneumoniae]